MTDAEMKFLERMYVSLMERNRDAEALSVWNKWVAEKRNRITARRGAEAS